MEYVIVALIVAGLAYVLWPKHKEVKKAPAEAKSEETPKVPVVEAKPEPVVEVKASAAIVKKPAKAKKPAAKKAKSAGEKTVEKKMPKLKVSK